MKSFIKKRREDSATLQRDPCLKINLTIKNCLNKNENLVLVFALFMFQILLSDLIYKVKIEFHATKNQINAITLF